MVFKDLNHIQLLEGWIHLYYKKDGFKTALQYDELVLKVYLGSWKLENHFLIVNPPFEAVLGFSDAGPCSLGETAALIRQRSQSWTSKVLGCSSFSPFQIRRTTRRIKVVDWLQLIGRSFRTLFGGKVGNVPKSFFVFVFLLQIFRFQYTSKMLRLGRMHEIADFVS